MNVKGFEQQTSPQRRKPTGTVVRVPQTTLFPLMVPQIQIKSGKTPTVPPVRATETLVAFDVAFVLLLAGLGFTVAGCLSLLWTEQFSRQFDLMLRKQYGLEMPLFHIRIALALGGLLCVFTGIFALGMAYFGYQGRRYKPTPVPAPASAMTRRAPSPPFVVWIMCERKVSITENSIFQTQLGV